MSRIINSSRASSGLVNAVAGPSRPAQVRVPYQARLTTIGSGAGAGAVRSYAAAPGSNPHLAPTDSKTDILRALLYPPESIAPTSSSPVGAHHPQHAARVNHIIQDPEVHETIERAYQLYRREQRTAQQASLQVKYAAMVEACDELDRMTQSGVLARGVYDRAMARTAGPVDKVEGKKNSPESRFSEARLEALFPREMWVPTETRGKGWNYDWKRPGTA